MPPPHQADAELLRDLAVLVARGLVVPVRRGATMRYAIADAGEATSTSRGRPDNGRADDGDGDGDGDGPDETAGGAA